MRPEVSFSRLIFVRVHHVRFVLSLKVPSVTKGYEGQDGYTPIALVLTAGVIGSSNGEIPVTHVTVQAGERMP